MRADVFDVLSGSRRPAPTPTVLQDVRRATVFLSEWRRLVALARLPAAAAAPARRLLELAARLQSSELAARSGLPLFECGPSVLDLTRLAELDEQRLLRCLRGEGTARTGLSALARAAGAPLVAELAAAHGGAAA